MENFAKLIKRSIVFSCLSAFLSGAVIGFLCGYYVPNQGRLNSVSSKLEGRERTTPLNLNTTTVQPSSSADYTHRHDDVQQVHSDLSQEASVETEGDVETASSAESSAEWSNVDSEYVSVSSEEEITKHKQLSAEEKYGTAGRGRRVSDQKRGFTKGGLGFDS